jgi:long-chain fatty acid transport protein
VFVNYHAPSSRAAFGLGVYVPYGLTTQWPDTFPGRFLAQKATLATVYVQPNFAWQITPNWSIGGGPIYGHSSVELIQALDLSQQGIPTVGTFAQLGIAPGTEFAQVRLKGSASAWGGQIGIAGHPSPNWSVGARFLSPLEFKYDDADATFTQVATNLTVGGDLPGPTPATSIKAGTPVDALVGSQFQAGGALVAQKASTKITHPSQIQAGVAYTGYKDWLLEADYAFIGWKRFDALPVNFAGPAAASSRTLVENYNNSSAIRLGAEYTIPTDGWKLRAGFAGVASAAPPETVTPLLPEQDRSYGTFGIGVPLMKALTVDVSYAHIFTPGARGRIAERVAGTPSATSTADQINSGVYNLSANVFSFTLKASF